MRKKVEHDARYFNITALQRELQQQRRIEGDDDGETRERVSAGAGAEESGRGIAAGGGAAAGRRPLAGAGSREARHSNHTNSSGSSHADETRATALPVAPAEPPPGAAAAVSTASAATGAAAAVGARADVAVALAPREYSQIEVTISDGKLGLSFAATKGFQQAQKVPGEQSEIEQLGFFVVRVAGQCKEQGVREGDRIVRIGATAVDANDGHEAIESLVGRLARPFTIVFERRELHVDTAANTGAGDHDAQDHDPPV